jgi:hypothetical protein
LYSLLFPTLASKFQVLYKCPWSTLSWYYYRVTEMDLVSVFWCRYPVFPATLLKRLSFLHHMFLVPLSKIRWE